MSFLARLLFDKGRGGRAPAASPTYAGLMTAGCDHQAAGRLAEAVECFDQALILKPDAADAYVCRGVAIKALGDAEKAADDAVRALNLTDSPVARTVFVASVEHLRAAQDLPATMHVLARALTDCWDHPEHLAKAAVDLIKQDPAVSAWMPWPVGKEFDPANFGLLGEHELLLALLTTAPVRDVELERLLTAARRAMLGRAGRVNASESALRFALALSRQCFINEYVFEIKDDEARAALALRERLQHALELQNHIDPFDLIVLASYICLHSMPGSERLLAGHFPDGVDALLTLQIREALEEESLEPGIRRITPIVNPVSRLVREHYEENPYPRWIATFAPKAVGSLDNFLRINFPDVSRAPVNAAERLDILVAGCGTGQDPIQVARHFPRASILAIDLSLASLAYALRKTREFGIDNIEYAQGDILELAALDRQFDLIETAGVLITMGDPLAGWRVLLALLRPNGVMALGLYSEIAREGIKVARRFIADKGYGGSAADIRRCRAEMMAPSGTVRWSLESADFFTVSGCRDLLFHGQESRFTLPQVKEFLAKNRLRFLGFVLPSSVKARYSARFPDDPAMIDLDNWHAFETENPYTFTDMYKFCVQKT